MENSDGHFRRKEALLLCLFACKRKSGVTVYGENSERRKTMTRGLMGILGDYSRCGKFFPPYRRGLFFGMMVFLFLIPLSAMAAEDHIQPLGSGYENVIVPKYRGWISFMDTDYGLKSFRGQSDTLETDLSKYYGVDMKVSTAGDLGVSGTDDSKVFSQTQSFGLVPQTRILDQDFMGMSTFNNVPTGVLCTSYLTKLDDDGDETEFWMELTGRSETTGAVGRIGRVKISDIYRPYFKYKFNADLEHKDAPALDRNVAHDMVAWDWNQDGYTDWVVSYLTNPKGKDSWENMKIAFLFVDGRSLYEACCGIGTVRVWENEDYFLEFTTGGDVIGGLTYAKPPNSIRTALGDMDGDGNPEVAVYYTKVQGSDTKENDDHYDHLKVINISYNGSDTPEWSWFYEDDSDVGMWSRQYDSLTVTLGDLDGDGFDEMVTLHSRSQTLYLHVFKVVDGKVEIIVNEEVGTTSELAGKSTPAVEASIADFDGDGFNELVYVHTESDHATRLCIKIQKWSVVDGAVALSGGGTQYSYKLTDLDDDWRMDSDHARFSLATGMFTYPETEVLSDQIGLVTTLDGSSGKNGLGWGFFTWNAPSGLKLVAKGTKADAQLGCNVVPFMAPSDLDDDSMVLGEPTGFTVYDNIEPVFIIQAPPRHWDSVTVGGEAKIMDAFAVLNGYSTALTGKTTDAQGESTTKTSSGNWGASAGVTVSKVHHGKDNTPILTTGLKYAGTAASKNTNSETVTTSVSLSATAQYDDQIYYRANTHDVWRYPVLAPASQAFVTDGDTTYRKYVQFIVPQVIESSFVPTAGKEVDWYEPWHNGLNLFSYPRNLEQTRDFPQGASSKPDDDFWKDINGLVFAKSTGQIMGNVDSTQANFTVEIKEHEEDLKSIKNTISAYANLNFPSRGKFISVTGNFSLNGDYSYGTDTITTSDKSQLGGITVSWPGVSSYVSPSGATPSDQQFTVDAAIYTSDAGVVSFAYAVSSLYKKYSALWGDTSPYNTTADPALNLPRQWVINGGKWQANPYSGDASRLRGLLFQEASLVASGGVYGDALPMNTEVHATLRVYNYSFVATGAVAVELRFQPITSTHEDPDISKASLLGSTTIASIPGRDSGTSNNWEDFGIVFTTHSTQTMGYLHVKLSTEGGNLQTNNDVGQILVGIYDPAQSAFGTVQAISTEEGSRFPEAASSGKSLSLVENSLSVRPLNEDGTLGEETNSLDPGQAAVVQATVLFTDAKGTEKTSLLNTSVYLRNDKGILSHRVLPLLENGVDCPVRMLYTAPDTDQVVPLRMIVTASLLPAAEDENPEERTIARTLTIGNPASGGGTGGCTFGFSPGAILFALPLLWVLKKR